MCFLFEVSFYISLEKKADLSRDRSYDLSKETNVRAVASFTGMLLKQLNLLKLWSVFIFGVSDMFHIQSYKNGPNLNDSKAVSSFRFFLNKQTLFTQLSSNVLQSTGGLLAYS